MEIETAWVKPAFEAGGQDHLGVQATSGAMYAQRLPGITNVTERARYYSFYPWLLWSFENKKIRGTPSLEQVIRRAEVLLALIGGHHTRTTGEADVLHGQGLVGRLRIDQALREEDLSLIELAAPRDEVSRSYFKNPQGGLGQYYFGPLREIRVLDGSAFDDIVFTKTRGTSLAQAFDSGIDAKAFFEALSRDRVSLKTLDSLTAFCPCGLARNKPELEALRNLFFKESSEDGVRRAQTLELLLRHEKASSGAGFDDVQRRFRAAVYSGGVNPGKPWKLSKALSAARELWGTYARNELLSVAVQGIFWATLKVIEKAGGRVDSSAAAVRLLRDVAVKQLPSVVFSKHVETSRRNLPTLDAWEEAGHETQQADVVLGADDVPEMVKAALAVIVALAARAPADHDPYQGYDFSPAYLADYPINLRSMQRLAADEWSQLSLPDVVGWLGSRWGIEAHLRVALRKLNAETKDKFCVRPTERGLELGDAIPRPVYTSPRFWTARQILVDLALVEIDGGLTTEGNHFLESANG
jgi:hypothetical protein